jgi:hypothetical protein
MTTLVASSNRPAKRRATCLISSTTTTPEVAFSNALEALMRAADVRVGCRDNSIHPIIALEVLIGEFGLESVHG